MPSPRTRVTDRRTALGLAAVVLLWLALAPLGLDWGLPNARSWSNDDIAPKFPLQAPGEWRSGTDKYPYLQAFIDRAIYTPALRAWAAEGSFDPGCPAGKTRCFQRPHAQLGHLIRLSRLRSLAMGLGLILVLAALAWRLYGDRRAAVLAALAAATTQVLVFFGRMGNLDLPQTFWFLLSILALERLLRRGDRRGYWAFGILGACAIGTKDGIVGAYVLPALLVLAVHAGRARRAARAEGGAVWRRFLDARMLGLVIGLFGSYALIMNPVFNPAGFRGHLDHWLVGEGIKGYNQDFEGSWALLLETVYRVRESQGWPLFLLSGVGIGLGLVRRPRQTAWLLLPASSYVLFTILPIHFVYNRFVLPLAALLAVPAGLAAAWLWGQTGRRAWLARPVVALAFAYSLLYALNMLLGMQGDTRYAAEAFLRETVPVEAVIHTLGPEEYLPRVDWLGFAREQTMNWDELGAGYPLDPGPEAKTGVPDYVVLSDKSWPRRADAERPILDRLLSGEAGYAVVFDQERRPALQAWLPGAWMELRVSPRIVILARDRD